MYRLMLFIILDRNLAIIFQIFFLPLPHSPILLRFPLSILWRAWCVHSSLWLCSVFFILFSFCFSEQIISINNLSSLILYSSCSYLLLSPCTEFFILVNILFNCRICILFSFLFLSFCCYYLLGKTSFSHFPLIL